MDLTRAKLDPFLPTLRTDQSTKVDAWITVLGPLLNARYGDAITAELEPVFVSAAADAIIRRLERPRGGAIEERVGPASIKRDPRFLLSAWFLPEELEQLDDVIGAGSIRSHRTPAPDAQRFGNRYRPEVPDELPEW
ncbi:hypothetical protein [Leucobacter ruminantium]|uniref:Uncharacterized protein n=1 Tax=Leucobacter ruminantium TaxID=1289170 RepID=A0A939LWQ3_9MICO|nr:hypothetical protein [Leucobacter ruminantium]MBO1805842.1 hypothetical protein [Leucobacter ruminantium]